MILDNKHTELVQEIIGDEFRGMFAEQLGQARSSVFNEMCQEMNITNLDDVRACNMAKKTITRDKLVNWLETVWCLLNNYAVPLLFSAVDWEDECHKLRKEKIKDQEAIIKLQEKLIEKKDNEISNVQSTVQSEMKNYSAAVSKSCKTALAPKRIQAAVEKVAEKSDRSRNVIIYGVQEQKDEVLENRVNEILAEIDEKPRVQNCCRIGLVKSEQNCRLVKFTLSSNDHVKQVLTKCKLLRSKEGYTSIYICPDRSVEERVAFKKLLEELKLKRTSEPGYVHSIRNKKIISIPRDSKPPE